MLKIHNSLNGQKEAFEPITPGKVGIYVCGITVYDHLHIGHARMLTAFDVIVRFLRFSGLEVHYVRNITDIDDKIIARAAENGEPFDALTERFIQAMNEDSDALSIVRPDVEPRATENIPGMIEMIQALIDNKAAYQGDNGDVYFAVTAFPEYGCLSGKNPEDLRAGSRIEVDESKRDPLDFVLWKAAKPGEPFWESPWGNGRPGWHIECSAMSTHELGDHFDIHGGGMDLKFPHHENEIAQTCAAKDTKFANYWLHNGFVQVDDEKMSKSLGNFFTVREVLKLYQPEVLRYFLVSSHYRSPLNYTQDNLDQAKAALDGIYRALSDLDLTVEPSQQYTEKFSEPLRDDFNFAGAVAVLKEIETEINKAKTAGNHALASALAAELKQLGGVMGLAQNDPVGHLKRQSPVSDDDWVNELIAKRDQARAEKNWAESDRIRDELKSQGIVLEDGPTGTTWRRS
ncbi:MAG: cysteine--tRNA ligase [Pseudomonadota bacterium]